MFVSQTPIRKSCNTSVLKSSHNFDKLHSLHCKVVQPCDGKGDSSQPPTNSKTLNHEPKSQAILKDIGLKYGKFAGKGDTCQPLHYQPSASSWAPTFNILEEGSKCLV